METLTSSMTKGVLALILTAAASFLFSPIAKAGTLNSYSSPWQPFSTEGLNNCNNETYAFSGQILVEVKTVADNSGGLHVSTLIRVRGIGIGNNTGARYIDNEGGQATENLLPSGALDYTAVFNGTVIAVDKGVPDLHYRSLFHITVDANGNVTVRIDKFEILC
ncbi:hypothetical protein CupriaWKF_22925 [Cupriavidus sp. WKF15]|uniref:hypothetical protein n=1 Tax=Cupriavidus sp. WKF15 TaxID=3032282 RepID=UPI0023E185B0|nr:hypothetical protein [Cupriavidus sp. WKF15]WER49960.1 hypothetical protein CupriaWKF_22925 [Cupriavidus sp. WKF15]